MNMQMCYGREWMVCQCVRCQKCICFCFLHFVLQNFFLCVMACSISSYVVYSVHNKCKYVNISEVITTFIRQNMICIRLFFVVRRRTA